ncbi:SCO family protein [Pedobacter metabolipauper]|uniref:Protein SCO1/2 n=1 Tax=Pedobacter metabolipauper TaxID=425513 RepID=A0A4R6SSX3_9SPHI|nr:SCO family protein [Pedobacter metabolipauper]TDQ06584.1 protein SCO1/2 [Pedobacter metabolipauper]
MNAASIKKVLILVTILAVPGFLYYLLQDKGKNRYRPLAIFGPKAVASTFHSVRGKNIPDTIYHVVDDFKLINQAGDSVSWKNYDRKVVIVSLFYTTGNTHAVTFANKAMRAFDATFDHNKSVNFISLSIDPVKDNPAVISAFAKTLPAKAGKWDMLTGDSTHIYNLINKGLFIDAHQDLTGGEKKFIYSNMFVLLDMKHRIRGYYEATSQEALSKLDDEIKVLMAEELRNTNDGR